MLGRLRKPLAAVYGTRDPGSDRSPFGSRPSASVLPLEVLPTRVIEAGELTGAGLEFETLRNLNTAADYAAALRDAGLERRGGTERGPTVRLSCLGRW